MAASEEDELEPEERELAFSFESKKDPTAVSNSNGAQPDLALDASDRRDQTWSSTPPRPGEKEFPRTSREVRSEEGIADLQPDSVPQESAFDENWWSASGRETGRAEGDANAAALSTAPYLTLTALLILFFSTISLDYSSRPSRLDAVLRAIPLAGPSIFKNNHLKDAIDAQSVTAHVQAIRGNREVFTIAGSVINRNTVSVREVRLEGYVYNGDGKELARQAIWIGSPVSARIIRDVEPRELLILQELGPQKRFEILPEQSVPFVIVFLKPAKEIRSFGYRVLSAEEVS